MANAVFANGREVSCKAAAGKTICAMPDVCFTPPENPATPPGVPIPYPNTGMASDTSGGSKKVKISKKEVGLKNKSNFKKSMGDEAGAAAKKGVITSKNTGKVFFESWSMDVKIEGKNAVRHLDMTTNNHASTPGDTPPWPYTDLMSEAQLKDCKGDRKKENDDCKNLMVKKGDPAVMDRKATENKMCEDTPEARKCQEARKCMLVPYKPDKQKKKEIGCCPSGTALATTPHHVLPKSSFAGWGKYKQKRAPCVCAAGHSYYDEDHGDLHTRYGVVAMHKKNDEGNWPSRDDATNAGAKSVKKTFPASGCNEKCLKAQLNAYHDSVADDPEKPMKATHPMEADEAKRNAARKLMDVPIPGAGGR